MFMNEDSSAQSTHASFNEDPEKVRPACLVPEKQSICREKSLPLKN